MIGPGTEKDITMNNDVFITCALTGAGDTTGKSPYVPVTPEQIADSAIKAAKAGAAIAHIHVRDIETGQGNRDREAFREVVARIRDSDTDVIINLTTGMGGDYTPETLDAGERVAVESGGGEIVIIPFVPGKSTTDIIQRMND